MSRRLALLAPFLLACLVALPGCQTLRSWEAGCPGIYSGLRYYKDQVSWLPFDGKIFFTVDVPFSAVADTLLLPVSWIPEPEPPLGGFAYGCRWAKE